MNKKIFLLVIAIIASITAESQTNQSSTRNMYTKHGYAELVSLSYTLLNPEVGDKFHCVGIKSGGGFYPFNDMTRLGIEIGLQSSTNDITIGSFAYEKTQNGRRTLHTDGIIKRDLTIVPILVNWDFEFGSKIMFRLGPTIGIAPLKSVNSFEPVTDDSKDYVVKQRKTPFVYGGNTELSIEINEIIKLNLGYKYLRLTSFTFTDNSVNNVAIKYNSPTTEMKITGHQIAAGILFVF
jgi:opacity protein-like surface antigen